MPGDFTDLIAWQEASALVADVHRLAASIRGIAAAEAAVQLVTAAESIAANIAEGYGRGLGRDYCGFLRIAIGSATELENHLRSAVMAGRVSKERAEPVIERARRVRALTAGLLRWVERRSAQG